MIPKLIHHVWPSEGDIIPDKYQRWMSTWYNFHPEWEFKLWRLDNLPKDLMLKESYDVMMNPRITVTVKSDIIRLEIVRIFGGIYLDTDMECLKDITPLLNENLLVGDENPKAIGTSLIGCEKNHPLIIEALNQAHRNIKQNRIRELNKNVLGITGPGMFTKVCAKFNYHIYPQHYFYLYEGQVDNRSYSKHCLSSHQPLGWLFQNKFSDTYRMRIIILNKPINKDIRESIFNQNISESKHIVVCSKDRSKELALKYKDPYTVFVNNNVLQLDKNNFNDMIEFLEDNKQYDAVGFNKDCFMVRREALNKLESLNMYTMDSSNKILCI